MQILIAEDDPVSGAILEAALRQWGHAVIVCSDGLQAWEALRQPQAPRLGILDWMMPGLEGPEICRRVRQMSRARMAYLILLTGRDRREDVVAGLEAGADDYITKPFDEQELRARVQVGVRVVELQEQLLEAEKVQVLAQTAGAAAHEINQPLTVLLGLTQLLLKTAPPDFPQRDKLETLHAEGRRISRIVRQMASARQYATKSYVEGTRIVDFGAAARPDEGPPG